MKKILLAIVITIIFIYVVPFYLSPENYSEKNLFYAHGMGVLFVSAIMFLVYGVLGVPVTLVIDSIVKLIPKKGIIYTYLIQLFLYFISIVIITSIYKSLTLETIKGLSFYVYIYFHILFLFRLPNGKANLNLIDLFSKKSKSI